MIRPWIVVPTYNERENLPALLDVLLRLPDVCVLVESAVLPWRLMMRRE